MKILKNTSTPRLFIAATRQNDGKTTTSVGLLAAMRSAFPRIGYIKPIGQRLVEASHRMVDEDTVLMDKVYGLNCPIDEMNPIPVEQDFTKQYLRSSHNEVLACRIQQAFDRVAWEKDLVVCEGTGHAGVGSIFDLSNARVANLVGAKVLIITRGGIGRALDDIALNQALFEKEGVSIIGVILNKVIPDKIGYVSELAQEGLRRRGLRLLGAIPHKPLLSSPTIDLIREELEVEQINRSPRIHAVVKGLVIGTMNPASVRRFLRPGALFILSGDRDDLMRALFAEVDPETTEGLSGIILAEGARPSPAMLRRIESLPCPVFLSRQDSFEVSTRIKEAIVKTRPGDLEKITLIRDLVRKHVDISRIIGAIT